jgi:membrane fusion protein (multidrug efflux system)
MDAPDSTIPTPRRQRLTDFRRRTLPVVVWCAAALVCAVALVQRGRRLECVGIAEARQHELSVAVAGVVDRIEVALLDRIDAGDVVARLDEGMLRARVETSRARLHQLAAQLDAARHASRAGEANLTGELLRVQLDEDRRRLDASALRGQIEADGIEVERLSLEAERQRRLFEDGVIGTADYDDARLRHESATRRLQENRTLLAEAEREQQAAEDRRARYERELPDIFAADPVLGPLREAIVVEGHVLDEIELQRAATQLRSPVDGQVTRILCRPGQAVVPGQAIVTVVEMVPREIVAWLVEADARQVRPGARVRLTTRHAPGRSAESVVLRGGGAVQPLPDRLWRDPRVADYGRAVVIAAVPALAVEPGERVGVSFLED